MSDTNEELTKMVESYRDDIEAAVEGELYDVDGNYTVIDDIDEWKESEYEKKKDAFMEKHPESEGFDDELYDSYEEYMVDEIGDVDDIDEPDNVSLADYIEQVSLGDTRFEVGSDKSLYAARVLAAFGGPNIWIADDEVRGYWGLSTVTRGFSYSTERALFNYFEECWDVFK